MVGLADGSSDGELEGVQDGRDEGTSLGLELGSSDGDTEGLALGDADGDAEGLALGDIDGNAEGLTLGDAEGPALGLPDGDAVGDVDGNSVKLTDPCRWRAWRAQSCRTRRECMVLGRSWRRISESWLSAVDVARRRRSRAVVVIVELAMMVFMLAQFKRKVWLYVRFRLTE